MKEQLDKLLREQLKYPDSKSSGQRTIADLIEEDCNKLITENFANVTPAKSNRTIEDINIGEYYVDHKSSDAAREFKMPNLISIDRLRKITRPLVYNFIIYDSSNKTIVDNFSLSVYELNWDYLKIQNLGKGQLQITNMVEFLKNPKTNQTKEQWLNRLKQEAITFYKKVQADAKKRQADWEKN